MKSYNKVVKDRIVRDQVRQEMLVYAEHYDLVLLWLMHEKLGFGEKRLRQFYKDYVAVYNEFCRKYYSDDDVEQFGSRTDTYVLKEKLKAIGFDYDKETAEMEAEG